MTHSQLVIDMAWGCIWRYRWLGLVCLFPLLEAIIFDSVAMVLVVGTTLSQLVLLVMLALFLSILLQTAMRARMVIITVVLALAFNANAFLRNLDGAQTLLFVPFQRYPYPFIHSGANAIELASMIFLYWLVHWVLAYFLLLLIVKQLKRYAARS